MTSAQICIMIAIIVYLIGMIYIGFRCSKKNNSTDDFYLGGRKLGPFVTAMSAEASDMSSWLLMGLPGVAYLTGISDAGWTAIGLAAGTYINWLIVAKSAAIRTPATIPLPSHRSSATAIAMKKRCCRSLLLFLLLSFLFLIRPLDLPHAENFFPAYSG